MKKFFNILLKILGVITAIVLALVIITISSASQKIPQIEVASSTEEIQALIGNYVWNSFSDVNTMDNHSKSDYNYKSENSLLVSPNDKLTIRNTSSIGTTYYFEQEEFYYDDAESNSYDVYGNVVSDSYKPTTFIDFNAPQKEGTYYYFIKLNYKEKGNVEYSFKVVVSSEPTYNILDLVKYKNTDLLDATKIREIVSLLPYSRNVSNISIKAQNDPKEIDVYYDEIFTSRQNYNNVAIALLTLIPDANIVSFYAPNANYVFSRTELERIQGRDLIEYINDPALWEQETMYKEKVTSFEDSKEIAYQKIIEDLLRLDSGEKVSNLVVDTNSFENNSPLGLSRISKIKLIDNLKVYCNTIVDMSIVSNSSIKSNTIYIGAEPIVVESGDIEIENEENINEVETIDGTDITSANEVNNTDVSEDGTDSYLIKILFIKDSKIYNYDYDIGYINGTWTVSQHNQQHNTLNN